MNVHMFQGIETTLMYNLPTYDVGKLYVYVNSFNCVCIYMLGCMAEHLKTKILETDKTVDLVAGPGKDSNTPYIHIGTVFPVYSVVLCCK